MQHGRDQKNATAVFCFLKPISKNSRRTEAASLVLVVVAALVSMLPPGISAAPAACSPRHPTLAAAPVLSPSARCSSPSPFRAFSILLLMTRRAMIRWTIDPAPWRPTVVASSSAWWWRLLLLLRRTCRIVVAPSVAVEARCLPVVRHGDGNAPSVRPSSQVFQEATGYLFHLLLLRLLLLLLVPCHGEPAVGVRDENGGTSSPTSMTRHRIAERGSRERRQHATADLTRGTL